MLFNNKFVFFYFCHLTFIQILAFSMQTVHSKSSCVILKLIKTNYDIFVLYNLFTDVSTSPGVISNMINQFNNSVAIIAQSPLQSNSCKLRKNVLGYFCSSPTYCNDFYAVLVTLLKIFFVFIYSFFRTKKLNTGRQFRT